jgi:hypothetical protein
MSPGDLVMIDFATLSQVYAQGLVAGCSSVLLAVPVRVIIRAVRMG